jgi:hypothetical protein
MSTVYKLMVSPKPQNWQAIYCIALMTVRITVVTNFIPLLRDQNRDMGGKRQETRELEGDKSVRPQTEPKFLVLLQELSQL